MSAFVETSKDADKESTRAENRPPFPGEFRREALKLMRTATGRCRSWSRIWASPLVCRHDRQPFAS